MLTDLATILERRLNDANQCMHGIGHRTGGWEVVSETDGDEVESPFLIQFGLSEMGIAPAGIDRENTGHHHLLINVKDLDFSKPIPASKNHIHFGGGQTESLVELPPGDYRLQLVLGDMTHTPHTPPVVSKPINITVKD